MDVLLCFIKCDYSFFQLFFCYFVQLLIFNILIMDKKLTRSKNQMIAGVCAGIAEYFDWDPTLVRAAYAVSIFFFGFGFLLYLVLWLIMPTSKEEL